MLNSEYIDARLHCGCMLESKQVQLRTETNQQRETDDDDDVNLGSEIRDHQANATLLHQSTMDAVQSRFRHFLTRLETVAQHRKSVILGQSFALTLGRAVYWATDLELLQKRQRGQQAPLEALSSYPQTQLVGSLTVL